MTRQKKQFEIAKSRFVKIRCPKCKNEQIIFGKAVTRVRCLICNQVLTEPSGGKAKIKAKVLEVLS
jgi:small subunit ribosomal protein S27e